MDVFGSFALLLAFICAVYAFIGGIVAIRTRHPLLVKSTRQAGLATCGLIFLATISLEYLFFSDNFSVAYVVAHSNRSLSPFYKIAALWAGQEGSLLFWSFLLAVYVFSALLAYRNKNGELMPYVGVVLAGVQIFFLTLNNFVASPFKALGVAGTNGAMDLVARGDGNGLNPLLQYPEMVIHPPNLYSGYTGFTIPFAFALGALLARYPGEKWIHLTRKWTMIAWGFQTAGILLGAHWAYAVLGWGGYWAWDPVENASLLPWLTGTAFLHSVMMQEKRGMMKVWNVWLVFSTFLLCILGTFLTRSGVVSSVHAFASSNIGAWFVGFLIVILGTCLAAYFKNSDYLKSENQLDSIVSRESSFLFNNLILLVSCIAVLSGTLFPVFSEWFTGDRISVGTPFFNKVNIPIGLLLLFLTGVGPLLAWRKTSLDSLKRNFGWPLVDGSYRGSHRLSAWCARILFFDLPHPLRLRSLHDLHGVLPRRQSDSRAFRRFFSCFRGGSHHAKYPQVWRLHRAHGHGHDLHRDRGHGIQSGLTERNADRLHHADRSAIPCCCRISTIRQEKNYTAERMIIEVTRDNKPVMMLYPERRIFPANQASGTMVAIYSTLKQDLYVVYAGQSPDTQAPVMHVYLNPLVKCIWFGGVIVVLGTLVALLPNRRAVLVFSAVQEPTRVKSLAGTLTPSPTLREGHD